MNGADLAIAIVVLLSMMIGLFRGLLVEVLSIAIWILATVLSALVGPVLADALGGQIDTPSLRIFLGYALVFVGTLLMGALGLWFAKKLVQTTGLSGTDRLLGLLFGAARGVALTVLLILIAGLTPIPQDRWWRESRALPVFLPLAEAALALVPERLARFVQLGPAPLAPT
ncbi:colicin V production CvpA [Ahniella affigens]|uniref:Colicin V production CvpA n=1 Tax=Ahniella affigens TaxID=2021234 RepID=A0A2P1PTH1_9GAMM|nr:CvpA family protein [Ahniella affigens]AVP98147.1 colicin V production CvpA [Ahniella affigens]